MRKKILSLGVVMLLMMTAFSGCKGNKAVTKLVGIKNKQITLNIWKQKGCPDDMLDSSNNRFTQRYPNVNIVVKEVSKEQIEGIKNDNKSETPDVILLDNSFITDLAKNNLIRTLDNFVDKNFINSINQKAIDGSKYSDKLYMIPNSFIDGSIVVYNKKLLKKPYNTFNEIIKSKGKFDFTIDDDKFMSFFNAFSGKLFDANGKVTFNSKEMVKTLNYLKWLAVSNNIGKANSEDKVIKDLKDKKILEAIISMSSAAKLDKDQFGYTSMPVVETAKKQLVPFYKLRGFVVENKKMNKAKSEMVKSYLKFNSEKDLQAEFVAGKNHMTVLKTLTKDINGNSQSYLTEYREQLNKSMPAPNNLDVSKAAAVIMNEYKKFIANKETPQQAIVNMQKAYGGTIKTKSVYKYKALKN